MYSAATRIPSVGHHGSLVARIHARCVDELHVYNPQILQRPLTRTVVRSNWITCKPRRVGRLREIDHLIELHTYNSAATARSGGH